MLPGRFGVAVAAALCTSVLVAFAAPSASANMTYFGGPIIRSAKVVLVDWGSSVSSTYTSGDPNFVNALAGQTGSPTGITGVLAQYLDSSGTNYTGGTYESQHVITPSVSGTTIDDSDIQSELVSQINGGALPAPSGDGLSTLYVVLFPAGDTICDSPGSCSDNTFCAYHSDTALNGSTSVLYAVMPDEASGGGCGSDSAFNNQTMILSHEWAEAINDPLVAEAASFAAPLAWYDRPNNGEIADLCNQDEASNGSFKVQRLWSNLDGGCVSGESKFGTPGAAFAAPSGVQPGQSASFSGANSTDPSGNHASVTWSGQTRSVSSGIASYSWSWGDGSPGSSGVSASHTFAAPGTYNVTLTVKDNLGFVGAVTQQVVVGGSPPPSSPTAQPPQAAALPATGVGPFAGTLQGTLDPRGTATSYHFEYGTTTAYGASTPTASAGSGTGAVPVSYAIAALAPATTYHYRLVASSAGGTSTSADQTFTTTAAPPPSNAGAPKLSSLKVAKQRLGRLLAHGLKVRFTCNEACTVTFTLTFRLPPGLGARATPLVLALGKARLKARGSRSVVLRFNRSGRKALGHRRSAKLLLTGTATDHAGRQSKPVVVKLTVRR